MLTLYSTSSQDFQMTCFFYPKVTFTRFFFYSVVPKTDFVFSLNCCQVYSPVNFIHASVPSIITSLTQWKTMEPLPFYGL